MCKRCVIDDNNLPENNMDVEEREQKCTPGNCLGHIVAHDCKESGIRTFITHTKDPHWKEEIKKLEVEIGVLKDLLIKGLRQ